MRVHVQLAANDMVCKLHTVVTLGPNLAGCYIEVAFLLSGIQNHHNSVAYFECITEFDAL